MPKSLQILHRMQTRQPQHQTTRLTSRYRVATLRIVLQGDRTPQEQLPLPADREYGLVNAIPAGYESDDSWDNLSHTHDHTHTNNIVPLLTLCPWRNSPRRAPEQQQFQQQNTTNVRLGNALYSWPWDNQPYGRYTRSQQALRARAYRKIQRRYPLQ